MSNDYDTLVVLTCTYGSVNEAIQEFESIKKAYHDLKAIDTFDAAVLEKEANGKVKIVKTHEQPTEDAAKTGAGFGLATGIVLALFPGARLGAALVAAATGIGAAIGALAGHASAGMSRGDLKELGETLDAGSAGLVVVAATNIEEKVRASLKKALKTMKKEIKANRKALEKEIKEAVTTTH